MSVIKIIKKTNSNIVSWVLVGLGSLYVGCKGTANTYLIHQYQKVFEAYENQQPKPVPDKLKQRFLQVLEDLEMEELDLKTCKVYLSIRPNINHIGFNGSKYGFRIGVPIKFCYETKDDINRNMKIESNVVDWKSEEGQLLEQSLILSENAQKFALAQEAFKCHGFYFYLSLFYPVAGLGTACAISELGYTKFQLGRKPVQARMVFYTLASVFAYGLYIFLEDKSIMFLERLFLSQVSSMGQNYIEGGIEYFDKELKTNKALRNLFHDGKKTIAASGNPNYFIRQKSLPLTYQKSYLEEELKNIKLKTEEMKEGAEIS